MSAPTPPPIYIYKILPSSGAAPPTPLPSSLPVSDLDSRDNFIHMSTSSQILGTLTAFFASDESVFILRVPYERVEKWVKWEDAVGVPADVKGGCWDIEGKSGYFPHIHGNGLTLGKNEIDGVGKWEKSSGGWSVDGWPFEDDKPKSKS